MTLLILAQLGLIPATSGAVPSDPAPATAVGLTVDSCVDADRDELRRLLEVEYRGPLAEPDRMDRTQVIVRCTEERNEVRVLVPRRPKETVRTVDLTGLGPVAREAKTRELALVIAELVRSAEASEPEAERVALPPPAPEKPAPSPSPAPPRWTQVGALFTAEKYSGGQAQMGPGMAARFAVTRYFNAELRAGARWAETLAVPDGDITSRGIEGGIGVGIDAFPNESRAGLLLTARAEVVWLQIQGHESGTAASGRSVSGLTVVAAAAPCVWMTLSRSLRVLAEPAVVVPIHKLAIEDQGLQAAAIAGVGVAATLGIVAHF
jgi:hypothetical protein